MWNPDGLTGFHCASMKEYLAVALLWFENQRIDARSRREEGCICGRGRNEEDGITISRECVRKLEGEVRDADNSFDGHNS